MYAIIQKIYYNITKEKDPTIYLDTSLFAFVHILKDVNRTLLKKGF